jgi:hypothetical protein
LIELKHIIKKGLLFTTIALMLYSGFTALCAFVRVNKLPIIYRLTDAVGIKGGNTYQKFIDFNENKKYDVIVIGSSHAYRGYDPRIFKKYGLEMFNLGTSGQSLVNSFFIAKNYIRKTNCKLLIIDISTRALESDGLESATDLIANINKEIPAAEMALNLKDPRALTMYSNRIWSKCYSPLKIDKDYMLNGYSQTTDSVKEVKINWYKHKQTDIAMQVMYFKKLIDYLKQSAIPFILVTHPLPIETAYASIEKELKTINDYAKQIKCNYFNYSRTVILNSRFDYFDDHHLNQSGVQKFNTVLLDSLRQLKIIN